MMLIDQIETSRRYTTSFRRNGGVQSGPYIERWNRQVHTTPSGIAQTLTTFLRNMCDRIEVNDASVEKLVEVVRCEQHTSYEGMLESPFEPTEIYRTIQAGGRKKAPGNDGPGREFYSHNWTIIKDDQCGVINQMFWARNTSQQQKRGVIVACRKRKGNKHQKTTAPSHSSTLTTRFLLVLSHNACVQCWQII